MKPDKSQMMQDRWQADPILFMTEVLDVEERFVWDKMEEVAYSVRDNNKTGVFAGHGVSKSYNAARLAIWFLTVFGPKATVITTAPSNDQVENILWREIAVAFNGAKYKLGGELTKKKLDMGINSNPKEGKWFAYGFATTPDTVTGEATRFQGFHNDHVLVIFDEAAGILPQIWRAAEHLLTTEEAETDAVSHWRWLAIGNPTSPYGQFAALEKDPEWNVITVSVKDTPNYKQKKLIIPGLSGRKYEETIRKKYGINSNMYKVRILGQKPTFGEGTYLGKFMAQAERAGHIKDLPINQLIPVHTFWDVGRTHTAAVCAQYIDRWLWVVDGYYDDEGSGWAAHAIWLQSRSTGSARWKYLYGEHWAPKDLWGTNAKNMSGELNVELAAKAGINFREVSAHNFDDRIAAARNIAATRVLFDKSSPGAMMILDALRKHHQRKNERESTDEKPAYYKDPVRDWTVHPFDAFGHMAIVFEWDGIETYEPNYMDKIPMKSPYNNKIGRGLKAIA